MLIILPPSETKAPGGTLGPLNLDSLSFSSLNQKRRLLIDELTSLSVEETLEQLGLSEKLRAEAEANQHLLTSPTMPAIERYTGVLYDALGDVDPSNVAIGSALFGVVMGSDPIPHYRLSGGSKLNGSTIKSRWGKAISEALSTDELIFDLRSGAYLNLGKAPGATTLRVEDANGKVISHFNKHYKGLVARELAGQHPESQGELVEKLSRKFSVHAEGTQITLVVGDRS